MLRQACVHQDFDYVDYAMNLFLSENVNPDTRCIAVLDELKKKARRLFNNKVWTCHYDFSVINRVCLISKMNLNFNFFKRKNA